MASLENRDALEASLMNIVEQESLKWIFVGGKGGVGKTTCSCCLALQLAKCRAKVLLVSTDPAHNVSDAFRQKFGPSPLPVAGTSNLYAMELDPAPPVDKDKLEEMLAKDGVGGGLSSLFGGDVLKTFPDLQEVISLAKVFKEVKSLDYSVVVFDTAPTGHTLRLLSMPPEVERGLGSLMAMKDNFAGLLGPMSSALGLPTITSDTISSRLSDILPTLKEITVEFKDPDRTTFVCVCIPEMLSLYETERLIQDLTQHDIDVQNVIVNRLLFPVSGPVGETNCQMCPAWQRIQRKYLAQVDDMYSDFHVCKLPLLPNEIRGLDYLQSFSENLTHPCDLSRTYTDDVMRGECAVGPTATPAPPLETCVDDLEPSLCNIMETKTLKWIFVGGKGGVGKTTTSSALAAQLSRVREKVLLVSTDPAHNLSDTFQQDLGKEPCLVNGFRNLFAMELDLSPVKEEQEELLAESEMDGGIASLLSDFLKSFPGITEIMALAALIRIVQLMEFSVVVFDTAPTGHTLRLLSIPVALEDTLGKVMGGGAMIGLLSTVGSMFGVGNSSPDDVQQGFAGILPAIKDLNKQFQDPTKTTFVCVCIAEFLSLYETERLVQELARYKIDTHNIVVNQLMFPLQGCISCSMCDSRRRIQRKYLDQICDLYEDFHITKLPLLTDEVHGVKSLSKFSARLLTPAESST